MKTPAVTLDSNSSELQPAPTTAVVESGPGAIWKVLPEWRDRLLAAGTINWSDLASHPGAELVKRGDGRTVWRVPVDGRVVFAKVTRYAGLAAGFKRHLGKGACAREWRCLLEARRVGVSTVAPIALGIIHGTPRHTVLLTEGVSGAEPFDSVWMRNVHRSSGAGRTDAARRLIRTISGLFAASHERGFIHGDAHPRNILLLRDGSAYEKACFVDLAGAGMSRRPVGLKRSLRSLAQLDQFFHRVAGKTDRLRFLNFYMGARKSPGMNWRNRDIRRSWLRALNDASRRHARRLAHTRDRRIGGNNSYFVATSLTNGWHLYAVVKLARRHVFPEPDVPDRSEDEWRGLLATILPLAARRNTGPLDGDIEGLHYEVRQVIGLGARMSASLFGSDHFRRFVECHKQRHRDITNCLALACAEHRTTGLVDKTLIIENGKKPGATTGVKG